MRSKIAFLKTLLVLFSWCTIANAQKVSCIAGNDSTVFIGTESSGVFKVTNNGSKWTHMDKLFPIPEKFRMEISKYKEISDDYPLSALSVDVQGNTIVVANCGGTYLSRDNGNSWEDIHQELPLEFLFNDVTVRGTEIYGKKKEPNLESAFQKSMLGNGSWNLVSRLAQIGAVNFNGNPVNKVSEIKISYPVTSYGQVILENPPMMVQCDRKDNIYLSTDQAKTWSKIYSKEEAKIKIAPLSLSIIGKSIYVGTADGIYVTHDNGATWNDWSANLKKALAAHSESMKQQDKEDDLFFNGLAACAYDKTPEAIAYFNKVIALNATHSGAFIGRGYSSLKMKKYESAISDFLVAYNNRGYFNSSFLAVVYSLSGNPVEADKFMELFINSSHNSQVIELKELEKQSPNDIKRNTTKLKVKSCNEYGFEKSAKYYMAQNNFDMALVQVNIAIGMNPDEYTFYKTRGYIHYKLKKNEEALNDYKTAVQLDSSCQDLVAQSSYSIHKPGPSKQVKYFYKDPEAWYALGEVNAFRGKPSAAIEAYTKAIQLNDKVAKYYVGRGLIYAAGKRNDEAKADFKSAVRVDPSYKNREYYINCSDCQGGFVDEAREMKVMGKLFIQDASGNLHRTDQRVEIVENGKIVTETVIVKAACSKCSFGKIRITL